VAAAFDRQHGDPDLADYALLLDRSAEMRRRHQRAQIVVARIVLRIERDPVDQRRAARQPLPRPRHAEQSTDDRLDARRLARIAKGHDAVQPIAIRDRNRRKTPLTRRFRDRLGLDRPLQHGETGKDAQGNKGAIGHLITLT